MVLFEYKIQGDKIIISESELRTELRRLTNNMTEAKEQNNDRWKFLAGQVKTIGDILMYFQFPEGRDNTDAVSFGG